MWSDAASYPKQTSEALGCVGDAATWPAVVRRLGLPAPPAAPTATDPATPHASDEKLLGSRVYVYTYVNDYGEEGPPSAASGVIDYYVNAGEDEAKPLTVADFTSPSEAAENLVLSKVRIYRTVQGSSSGALFFVAEIDYQVAIGEFYEFTDSFLDSDVTLNETLPTTATRIRPPDSGFTNLSWANNDILAGSIDNKLLVSETGIASAWPDGYSLSMESEIMAIGVLDDSMVVLTKTRPYVVYGQSPESLASKRLPFHQSCLSTLSLAHAPGMVLYASPDGIFAVAGVDGKVVTSGAYTREQWLALGPESLVSAVHDGSFIGFFRGTGKGIMFDLESFSGIISLDVGMPIWGMCSVEADDALYLLAKDETGYAIYSWRSGATAIPYTWRSGILVHASNASYGVVRIIGDFSNGKHSSMRLYGDGSLLVDLSISAPGIYRLPRYGRAKEYEVEFSGTADIDTVYLSKSMAELISGSAG